MPISYIRSCNNKINNFPGVASLREIYFFYSKCLSTMRHLGDTGWDGSTEDGRTDGRLAITYI
jgi:hypothetical protein